MQLSLALLLNLQKDDKTLQNYELPLLQVIPDCLSTMFHAYFDPRYKRVEAQSHLLLALNGLDDLTDMGLAVLQALQNLENREMSATREAYLTTVFHQLRLILDAVVGPSNKQHHLFVIPTISPNLTFLTSPKQRRQSTLDGGGSNGLGNSNLSSSWCDLSLIRMDSTESQTSQCSHQSAPPLSRSSPHSRSLLDVANVHDNSNSGGRRSSGAEMPKESLPFEIQVWSEMLMQHNTNESFGLEKMTDILLLFNTWMRAKRTCTCNVRVCVCACVCAFCSWVFCSWVFCS